MLTRIGTWWLSSVLTLQAASSGTKESADREIELRRCKKSERSSEGIKDLFVCEIFDGFV